MSKELFPVAILAGGLATRLRPLTETIPKSLVLINEEPFIAHQLRLLAQKGISKTVICLGYLGEQVVDFVGDGEAFGIHVSYSFDGPKLMGTAGALKQALPLLGDSFFVLYGDSYLECDYRIIQRTFEHKNKMALMTVFENNGQWDSSNVEFAAGKILAYDKKNRTHKMNYIDYGLGLFSKDAFENVSANTSTDLESVYSNLIKNNQLAAHQVYERFYEIGSFAGLEELNAYLK